MDHFERRLVEICCGERSALGRYTCASARCDRVRIDKSLDILNDETKRLVIRALCSENTAVWLSLPCTGGSKRNWYNYWHSPSSREGIDEKVKLYFRCLEICTSILREVRNVGFDPLIIMELPASCLYWTTHTMDMFLEEFGMKTAITHGCAFWVCWEAW